MTVKVAIIDSGVNPSHFHVQKILGGHGYIVNKQGRVERTIDFIDQIGHGTAIAGIIRQKASFVHPYAIKIFHKDLTASASCLMEALDWAIKKSFDIIHLSLGIEKRNCINKLNLLCGLALKKNILILASARGPNDMIYPASFPSVIGVYWHRECSREQFVYHKDNDIGFGAYGYPIDIPGVPRNQNFRGNSFAVANMTARVAQLVKNNPGQDYYSVVKRLSQEAEIIPIYTKDLKEG